MKKKNLRIFKQFWILGLSKFSETVKINPEFLKKKKISHANFAYILGIFNIKKNSVHLKIACLTTLIID